MNQKTNTPEALPAQIMNLSMLPGRALLDCGGSPLAYKAGHRDARHAAAELISAALAAQSAPARPFAWLTIGTVCDKPVLSAATLEEPDETRRALAEADRQEIVPVFERAPGVARIVPPHLLTRALREAMMAAQVPSLYQPAILDHFYATYPQSAPAEPQPIDMVLHCPACGMQHVDAPEPGRLVSGGANAGRAYPGWSNPPHRSHLCHGCGHVWRPADVPTNGVAVVKTQGKADSPIVSRAAEPQPAPAGESAPDLLAAATQAAEVMERAKKLLRAAGFVMEGEGTIAKPYGEALDALRAALTAKPVAPAGEPDEREAFEAWGARAGLSLDRFALGDYRDGRAEGAWAAWQEASRRRPAGTETKK